MRKLPLTFLFVGKKKAVLKPWTQATAPTIYCWKKILVQYLIMEDLTYSVRIVPTKLSKMDKSGGIPCKEKMTQQKY